MNDKDEQDFDDKLMARAGELPRSVQPERDLWPGIEQVISAPLKPKRAAWNTAWAQAAAVVLLVGGSSGLTYVAMTDSVDPTTPVVATPTLVFEPVSGSFGSQYHLGPDYLDARRDLVGRLDDELSNLPPETRDEILINMQTIRQAIEEINNALAREPDNVLLQKLLLDAYRDELGLMMKIDSVANAAMRRDDI